MIAHIREVDGEEQSIGNHSRNTASLCSGYSRAIGMEKTGELAGLLHDMGKLTGEFQTYIRGQSNIVRGQIDHSYAGAKYLRSMTENFGEKYEGVSKLIGHIIISHHGLHDWLSSEDEDYYSMRIEKDEGYKEILNNLNEITDTDELNALSESAYREYTELIGKVKELAKAESVDKDIQKHSYAFYFGMLERFLQSCLIDADRTDTAGFLSNSAVEKDFDLPGVWEEMSVRMNERYELFSSRTDPISKQRNSISDRCFSFANHPVGACQLIVPTGGGKTLSSLRFAIEYCKRYQKKKIIYTAPFMSILEQNSDEICSIAGIENFTEHHSNLFSELESEEELLEYELRTEKWDSPVIATTMVQFLNTLFSGKSSSVRRMHQLSQAVIIIDEVQSIPLKCIHLTNLAINFLTRICGATVILCSATQPDFNQVDYPLLLDEKSSMTGDTDNDFAVFHRTNLISEIVPYGYSYEEAVDFCIQKFDENGNVLFIVNTKSAAQKIYHQLRERCPNTDILLLSTNLCPMDRRYKISKMKTLLKEKRNLICVSTQLVEAGVDISFRCVIRSLAGLDNAAQAAGRCNRSGEYKEPCPVYLVRLKEERVERLENVRQAQIITQQFLDNQQITDYLSNTTQGKYFHKLYHEERSKLSYPFDKRNPRNNILELLSLNGDHYSMCPEPKPSRFLVQAFKTAGSLFEVIDSKTVDVIVPFNEEAKQIIAELEKDQTPSGDKELLRKAQKYIVGVYNSKRLLENGAVRPIQGGVLVLNENWYDPECGVITEGAEQEILVF